MVGVEVGNVERFPQDVVDQTRRFFVSYAHEDKELSTTLVTKLQILFRGHTEVKFELWSDVKIPPGEKYYDEIQKAMKSCDVALLMLSPAFIASDFIKKVELPFLLQNKRCIPVALKPHSERSIPKGIQELQIFFDAGRKTFIDRATDRTREAFALQLFESIGEVRQDRSEPKLPIEHHLRLAIGEFDEERFVHTEGVLSTMSKALGDTPLIDATRRKDALEFLIEWIEDEKPRPTAPCSGNTEWARPLPAKLSPAICSTAAKKCEKVLLPIYLDLRYIGDSAKRELVLELVLNRPTQQ